MKRIVVTISPEGKATVEAFGFTGSACKSATKPIEDALGMGPDKHTVSKPEELATQSATVKTS